MEAGASVTSHGKTVNIARLPGALMLGAQRCHRAQRVRERESLHDRRPSVFSLGCEYIKLASEIWTHHPAPKSTLSRVTVHVEPQVPLANASEQELTIYINEGSS